MEGNAGLLRDQYSHRGLPGYRGYRGRGYRGLPGVTGGLPGVTGYRLGVTGVTGTATENALIPRAFIPLHHAPLANLQRVARRRHRLPALHHATRQKAPVAFFSHADREIYLKLLLLRIRRKHPRLLLIGESCP